MSVLFPLIIMLILYTLFKRSSSPRFRSWSLGFMLLSSIFLWLFIAASLVLCFAFAKEYQFELADGIGEVLGRAILFALAAALPFSLALRNLSPRFVLRKVEQLKPAPREFSDIFDSLAEKMGIESAEIQLSRGRMPLSFAVHVNRPTVVMSEKLLTLLNKDEIEAVMAHELAHIKNSDTSLKALVTAYKTVLPFDPLIRIVEAAFHREREMVADETAARVTLKPIALAMALIKIYEAFPKKHIASQTGFSILGVSSTIGKRHPPISDRVDRLIRLAEILA
ncbi:MAG TPA: M48 family metalloprotease [Candidatus Bathyarchaeia archaeon]|nr:M48 family metalloprotease [Candidatus Bathyarchaeia archaeon]